MRRSTLLLLVCLCGLPGIVSAAGGAFPYQPRPGASRPARPARTHAWQQPRTRPLNLSAARSKVFAKELKSALKGARWGDLHGAYVSIRRAARLARSPKEQKQLAKMHEKVRKGAIFHARRLAYQPLYDVKGINWPVEDAHFALNVARALGGGPGFEVALRNVTASAERSAIARVKRGDVAGTYSALEIGGADFDDPMIYGMRMKAIAEGLRRFPNDLKKLDHMNTEALNQMREQVAALREAHRIENLPLPRDFERQSRPYLAGVLTQPVLP